MFGPFRRRPSQDRPSKRQLDEETASKLIDLIVNLLGLQIAILPSPSIEDSDGTINRKAIGYIYGFVDSFLTTFGHDMSDLEIGPPITFHVFRKLFPNLGAYHAQRYLDFLMNNMRDETVALGMMVGGQQFLDYYNPSKKKEGAPMGLARFILEAGTCNKDTSAE